MYLILGLQCAGLFGEALEPSGDATLLERVLSGGGICGLTALVSAYSCVWMEDVVRQFPAPAAVLPHCPKL